VASAEKKAYCRIEKNSGTAAVEGIIDFAQEVGISTMFLLTVMLLVNSM